MTGESLQSLDETDIETLFDFMAYLAQKSEGEKTQTVTIGGKTFKKVAAFSTPIT